jgi:hypothetical protein
VSRPAARVSAATSPRANGEARRPARDGVNPRVRGAGRWWSGVERRAGTGYHSRLPSTPRWRGRRSTTAPGQVAQVVEQRTENPRVGGSTPPLATYNLGHRIDGTDRATSSIRPIAAFHASSRPSVTRPNSLHHPACGTNDHVGPIELDVVARVGHELVAPVPAPRCLVIVQGS